MSLPTVDEILERAHVVSLPMNVTFRGVTTREALLIEGPAGWGEFSPFLEYDAAESSAWLASGIEAAWQGFPEALRSHVEVNATIPAVPAHEVAAVLDGKLIDFGKRIEVPMRELALELLAFVDDVLDDLDSRREAEYVKQILADGTSAERQLQVYRETGDLRAVVRFLVDEMRATVERGAHSYHV